MPLRARDKWVIGLVAIFTVAWGTAAIIAAFWNPRGLTLGIASAATGHPIVSGILGALAVLAALHLFSLLWPNEDPDVALAGETGLGGVRVSLRAIEGLALQAARSVAGVAEAHIDVRSGAEGLNAHVRLSARGPGSIPELTARVQAEIERMLSRVAGIAVQSIEVRVTHVGPGSREEAT